jgi:hypothetical protein
MAVVVLEMGDQVSQLRWTDPALWRALVVAGVVILALLIPIAFGWQPQGTPSFDVTANPAGPLPF